MEKQIVRLERWSKDKGHLCGEIYGHPACREGALVITAKVAGPFGNVAQTKNIIYMLGAHL